MSVQPLSLHQGGDIYLGHSLGTAHVQLGPGLGLQLAPPGPSRFSPCSMRGLGRVSASPFAMGASGLGQRELGPRHLRSLMLWDGHGGCGGEGEYRGSVMLGSCHL